MSRAFEEIGSIVSCPLFIAARTDRRDSQFNEGARSSRTVGSESSFESRTKNGSGRRVDIAGVFGELIWR